MAHLKKPKRERNMVCCVLTDREREGERGNVPRHEIYTDTYLGQQIKYVLC